MEFAQLWWKGQQQLELADGMGTQVTTHQLLALHQCEKKLWWFEFRCAFWTIPQMERLISNKPAQNKCSTGSATMEAFEHVPLSI